MNKRRQRSSEGNLQGWLWQTEVFGLHFARLDIRQESGRNTRVVAELARALGLCPDYAALDEAARRALLSSLGTHAGPDAGGAQRRGAGDPGCLRGAAAGGGHRRREEALGGNIISMTHRFSDILAALWLMELRPGHGARPRRSWTSFPSSRPSRTSRTPTRWCGRCCTIAAYRRHLARRGDVQIVMIGYSDSTKDGGYLAACWALYKTQSVLSRVAQRARACA